MEKIEEFVAGRVSGSPSPERREGDRREDRRRGRGPVGEELRTELKLVRSQRRTLAISTAFLFLVCGSLAVWASNQQSALRATVIRKQTKIEKVSEELAVATTALAESRHSVDALVMDRIPGLVPFQIGESIPVDIPFVREISFKPAAPPIFGHECKVVVENASDSDVRPALRVLLFDDVGIQLAQAQLMDGVRDELRADEIRSFFAELETAEDSTPHYFLLTSN
jgi:hypothetical protein